MTLGSVIGHRALGALVSADEGAAALVAASPVAIRCGWRQIQAVLALNLA